MIRTVCLPNYATTAYKPGDPPRLLTEPVFVCDSRLLCTMMLRAWKPDADREMRRGLYRETYGTEPVTVPGFRAIREFQDGATGEAVELKAG